jgi:hypothetical protein
MKFAEHEFSPLNSTVKLLLQSEKGPVLASEDRPLLEPIG